MRSSQLNRVIKLLRRTGEKVMVMDDESDEVMMLMNLTDYEKMLSGSRGIEKMTEEELLEKINRDIAIWRSSNEKDEADIEEPEKVEPERSPIVSENKTNHIELGKEVKLSEELGSEGSFKDVASEESGEEEKFYIEPVE
ncbi:MAG: hypothetical protein AAB348_03195 [Patescibacteria group bacterium]